MDSLVDGVDDILKSYAFIYCTIQKFNTRLYNDAAREQASFCKAMPRSNNNNNNINNNKWNYKFIDINTTDNNDIHLRNNKQVEVIILNR